MVAGLPLSSKSVNRINFSTEGKFRRAKTPVKYREKLAGNRQVNLNAWEYFVMKENRRIF